MATPDQLGIEVGRFISDLALTHVKTPTGVVPQVVNGLTIGEDGRILRAENAGAAGVLIARAYGTSGQSVPNATNTIIDYDLVEEDLYSSIVTGASWTFTVPITGVYLFMTSGYMDFRSWTSTKEIHVYGTCSSFGAFDIAHIWPIGTNITPFWSGFGFIPATIGDTVQIFIRHSYGSTISLDSNLALAILKLL